MKRLKGHRPSPPMVVACAAFAIALVGTAVAAPIAVKSVLDKQEKKQVKRIAKNQVNSLASGLSVASAQTAANATNATNATNASSATNATNANNANALGGVALADVAVTDEADQAECFPNAGDFDVNCTAATVTLNEPSDVLVTVEGTWHSDDAEGGDVEGNCRIERGTVGISAVVEYGSDADQTVGNDFEQALHFSEMEPRPPGTYDYALSCNAVTGDFDLSHASVKVIALAQ